MSEKVIATAENGVAVTQPMIDSWCAAYDSGHLPDGYSYDGEVQQEQPRLAKLAEFAAVQKRIAERAARSKPWPEGKTADDLIREAKDERLATKHMLDQRDITGITTELSGKITELFPGERVETIVFGSYARGDAADGSDVDVLVLVDSSREEISEKNWAVGDIAAELLFDYGTVVSPIVENRGFFETNKAVLPFFKSVDKEGIKVLESRKGTKTPTSRKGVEVYA